MALEIESLLEKKEKILIINYYKRKYPNDEYPRVVLVASTSKGDFLQHCFYDDGKVIKRRVRQLELGEMEQWMNLEDYKRIEKTEFLAYTL